jgi:hypothetical protein
MYPVLGVRGANSYLFLSKEATVLVDTGYEGNTEKIPRIFQPSLRETVKVNFGLRLSLVQAFVAACISFLTNPLFLHEQVVVQVSLVDHSLYAQKFPGAFHSFLLVDTDFAIKDVLNSLNFL